MGYNKIELAKILPMIDFGCSVAEQDARLETARIETSAFNDLLNDKVDLIPGTKGSGKSALYRIFVDFMPDILLQQRKVVIAHGVQHQGDNVFLAYNDDFEKMNENEFVNFWCVYLVSLAKEHFIKNPQYTGLIKNCSNEVEKFRSACIKARIPDFEKQLSFRDVLGWGLYVISLWKPKLKYRPPGESGEFEVNIFGEKIDPPTISEKKSDEPILAQYAHDIKINLEAILKKAGLSLWLMIDRLDEIFPRRSELETRALRGLLRTLRIFESKEIRIKVFLRDDILSEVVSDGQGFTALTHVTARQADTLKWTEDQILDIIVRRLYASKELQDYLKIDSEKFTASHVYREEAFYKVFSKSVFRGNKQSSTLRWIYTHTADGRGVVTPRDVIDLLTRAKQKQEEEYNSDPSGESAFIIGPSAITYGLAELSKRKKTAFLQAEFPHLWKHIEKFIGGGTQYSENDLHTLLGKNWREIIEDLTSIGVLGTEKSGRKGSVIHKIPFLYRTGLEVKQGKA